MQPNAEKKLFLMKILLRTVFSIAAVLMILQAAILLIPKAMGYKVFAVMSGSMAPTLKVGTLVLVEPAEPSEVKEGDIATFRATKDKNKRFTHRIAGINSDSFITCGDNNPENDPEPVQFNRLVGIVRHSVPIAGFLTYFLSSPPIAAIMFGLLIFWFSVELHFIIKGYKPEENTAFSE